jgi:hypothetical protein
MGEKYDIELLHIGFSWSALEKNRVIAASGDTQKEAHENLIQKLHSEGTGGENGT